MTNCLRLERTQQWPKCDRQTGPKQEHDTQQTCRRMRKREKTERDNMTVCLFAGGVIVFIFGLLGTKCIRLKNIL